MIITPYPSAVSSEALNALKSIGKVVGMADHLGLIIGKSHEESYNLSRKKSLAKLQKKINLIATLV